MTLYSHSSPPPSTIRRNREGMCRPAPHVPPVACHSFVNHLSHRGIQACLRRRSLNHVRAPRPACGNTPQPLHPAGWQRSWLGGCGGRRGCRCRDPGRQVVLLRRALRAVREFPVSLSLTILAGVNRRNRLLDRLPGDCEKGRAVDRDVMAR